MEATTLNGARVQPTTQWLRTILLVCGVASSVFYVVMNVVAARHYEGYSLISHTISELSAIGAPSRHLWVTLGIVVLAMALIGHLPGRGSSGDGRGGVPRSGRSRAGRAGSAPSR